LVERVAAAGNSITDHFEEGLPHGYVLAQFLPEASSARREIAAILRRTDATIDR
jgi:acetyl esterase/lipase